MQEFQLHSLFESGAYASVTALSSSANFIMNKQAGFTRTYRTYIRPRESGSLQLRFWHSNAVDSTWDMGADASGGEPGGAWRIEAACAGDGGTEHDGSAILGSMVPFTFAGQDGLEVHAGENICSDEITVEVQEGHDLVFSWTITAHNSGKSIPYNVETMLATAYDAEGNLAASESSDGFHLSEQLLVLPAFIGYRRKTVRNIVLLGDSITQGVRTAQDAYEYWGARFTEGLGPNYGVWNIGSGWGRAYDLSASSPWLHKAMQGDEVLIVLGVNDIGTAGRSADELMGELSSIVALLKKNKPNGKIVLSTVPPFNFEGDKEQVRRTVNNWIMNTPPIGVDYVYDMAIVLAESEAVSHLVKPEYMSSSDDPHPNGLAGKAIAENYLNWHRTSELS